MVKRRYAKKTMGRRRVKKSYRRKRRYSKRSGNDYCFNVKCQMIVQATYNSTYDKAYVSVNWGSNLAPATNPYTNMNSIGEFGANSGRFREYWLRAVKIEWLPLGNLTSITASAIQYGEVCSSTNTLPNILFSEANTKGSPDYATFNAARYWKRFIRVSKSYAKVNEVYKNVGDSYSSSGTGISIRVSGNYGNGDVVGNVRATYYVRFKSPVYS